MHEKSYDSLTKASYSSKLKYLRTCIYHRRSTRCKEKSSYKEEEGAENTIRVCATIVTQTLLAKDHLDIAKAFNNFKHTAFL